MKLPAPNLPGWLNRLLPKNRRYVVSCGGRQMHVMEFGPEDGFPVLAVHGNPTWGFLYRRVAARLKGRPIRLIAPDLPGLGLSDRPSFSEHTLENHAEWMAALVETLALGDYVIVVQDWGGPIGVLGAARSSNPPVGMLVMNTSLSPPRIGFKPTPFHRLSQTPLVSDLVFRGMGFPQIHLAMVQGDSGSISGDVSRAYRWPLRRLSLNAAPLALARMVPDSQSHASIHTLGECHAFFEEFRGPVEFVWGNNDPILGSGIRWLQKVKPDAPCVNTPAGHFLQEEVPGEIAAAILRLREAVR